MNSYRRRPSVARSWLLLFVGFLLPMTVRAAVGDEFDNSKVKLQLNAWISSPQATSTGKAGRATSTCNGISGLETMPHSAADWTGASANKASPASLMFTAATQSVFAEKPQATHTNLVCVLRFSPDT
jgi:hypothetical protein